MFRRGMSIVLSVAAVPLAVVLPVVDLPTGPASAAPRPVAPQVVSLAVSGVDQAALRQSLAQGPRLGSAPGLLIRREFSLVSPVIEASLPQDRPFQLLGITWPDHGAAQAGVKAGAEAGTGAEAEAEPQIEVRLREARGWTAWQELHVAHDGPDAGTSDEPGPASATDTGRPTGQASEQATEQATEPLLTDGASAVQLRVRATAGAADTQLGSVRLHLIDPGSSPADAALDSAASGPPGASAVAATSRPVIITRRQWGADERLRSGTPAVSAQVRALFLHHTDGSNTYSRSQAAAQVRAVYAFHTRVRGWSDVGYNFLVDRFGRVFEGRAGSITQPMIGAHTGGFNANAQGVATIGNFENTAPPAGMVRSVTRLMAWLAARYEINPLGRTVLTSAGGGTSRYPIGTRVRKNTISGHRDVGYTACPGRYLYAKLPAIRAGIAAAMRPGLTAPVTTPSVVSAAAATAGTPPITFSARIPTTQRWVASFSSMCGALVRSFAGRSVGRITTSWNLHDRNGDPAPPGVYRTAVTTRSPVGRAAPYVGAVEVLPTAASIETGGGCSPERMALRDPYAASVAIGRRMAPAATEVVIASGAGQPLDALVAAPLARLHGAPLLLTGKDALPAAVAADLTARGVTTAWIVGSTGVVSATVQTQLTTLGVTTVTRLAGSTRYGTAEAVARAMGPNSRAVLAPGYAGAAAVTPGATLAAAVPRPLLLFGPAGLSASTGDTLRDLGVRRADLVTTSAARPARLVAQARAWRVRALTPSVGRTATDVAAAVATRYAPARAGRGVTVVAAARAGTVDAALAAGTGRLTLLSAYVVPAPTAVWLRRHRPASIWVTSWASGLGPVGVSRLQAWR